MLKNFPITLALCFMLSSPYYAENYVGIIDTSLIWVTWFTFLVGQVGHTRKLNYLDATQTSHVH